MIEKVYSLKNTEIPLLMETGEWPREFATQITSVHIAARIGSS
jgi:hypothetical protein